MIFHKILYWIFWAKIVYIGKKGQPPPHKQVARNAYVQTADTMPDIVPEKVHNNIWEIKINGPYSDILSAICCITFGTGAKADSW